MESNIALFDLDGTCADFDLAMARDLAQLRGPNEEKFPPSGPNLPKHILERRRLIKRQSGWWENLPPIPLGLFLYKLLKDAGFEMHVLTKGPFNTPNAWTEKFNWCMMHLGEDANVTITRNKSMVYGKILVDDWPEYVEGWLDSRPRGLVLLPDQPWNRDYSHPNALRVSQDVWEHGEEFATLLGTVRKIRDRGPGEPWLSQT